MTTAQALQKRETTAYSEAVEAFDKAGGDRQKAISILVDRVRNDRRLRDMILEPLTEYACGIQIDRVLRTGRELTWRAPSTAPKQSAPNAARRVIALAEDMLLSFPLPGGKKLVDATRDEVIAASDFYSKQAENMRHKSVWLRLVAQSVSGEKRVGECVTVERLRELQEEARNA
jgi:hypothetical protein